MADFDDDDDKKYYAIIEDPRVQGIYYNKSAAISAIERYQDTLRLMRQNALRLYGPFERFEEVVIWTWFRLAFDGIVPEDDKPLWVVMSGRQPGFYREAAAAEMQSIGFSGNFKKKCDGFLSALAFCMTTIAKSSAGVKAIAEVHKEMTKMSTTTTTAVGSDAHRSQSQSQQRQPFIPPYRQ